MHPESRNARDVTGDQILEEVYEQLRAAAQRCMVAERAGHTLSATALVHEAYLKLAGPREFAWQNRGHFYAAAAEAMRRILLDHARGRGRKKRSGAANAAALDAAAHLATDESAESVDFVALEEAICRLEGNDPRGGQIVRLRFYAGLSVEETAEMLGVSKRTVENDWKFAKAWLAKELNGSPASSDEYAS